MSCPKMIRRGPGNLCWHLSGLSGKFHAGMTRRLLKALFQFLGLAFLLFVLTGVWVIFDGMTDLGERADVAVIPGRSELVNGAPGPVLQARLDRAVQLYKDGEFGSIIVSGVTRFNGYDEAASMEKYLEDHEIPSDAITADHDGGDMEKTAQNVAAIMKGKKFHSVMIVTDYYHITGLKLALRHEELTEIEQAHSGKLQGEDLEPIANAVVALYAYLGKIYLVPTLEKAKEALSSGGEKAKAEVEKAKETVDKKIDSLPK